jgi:hypothetical protein
LFGRVHQLKKRAPRYISARHAGGRESAPRRKTSNGSGLRPEPPAVKIAAQKRDIAAMGFEEQVEHVSDDRNDTEQQVDHRIDADPRKSAAARAHLHAFVENEGTGHCGGKVAHAGDKPKQTIPAKTRSNDGQAKSRIKTGCDTVQPVNAVQTGSV